MTTAAASRSTSPGFPADAVRACLARVVTSPRFVRSHRLTRFLEFTVEALLEGRADELKERTIAMEVYGRRPDYDPRCDAIVRSEAHRLRAKLDAYYATEGSGDPIAIEYPRGSYLPVFRRNPAPGSRRARLQLPATRRLEEATGHRASQGAYERFVRARHGVLQYANTRQPEYLEPARRRLLGAIELEPEFADALADLAFLDLLQLNPPQAAPAFLIERARGLLERALTSDPSHVRSLYLLGDVHGTSGRARDGLDLTQAAVALDPEDAEAHSFLALRYASLGFFESAVAACEEALRLDPVWDVAHQAKALYASHAGAWDAALAALAQLHRVTVPSALSETTLAGVLAARGDLDGAGQALARARTRQSAQGDASYVEILEALVRALRGDAAAARAAFEAYRRSPPRIFDHLIRLSFALGESEAALGQISSTPYHRNYRWLACEPLARPFLREPGFRRLLGELHEEWLRDLAALGPRLPAAPLPLPAPAEILAGP